MACRPVAGDGLNSRSKAIDLREGGGSLVAAPFQSGAGMDAKTRDVALLAVLSLFCEGFA